ncbi:MAG: Ig domain-containing protein [Gemmatimonadetes bacterium]|nr:Ig domain-containing protein [Gemmatimonadota bacterium]
MRSSEKQALGLVLWALTACSSGDGGGTTGPGDTGVASVRVSPASDSLEVGQTLQLTATARDSRGNTLTGKTVTWSSSDALTATVSATGLVTGVKAGTVTITARVDNASGTASVKVKSAQVPVASVTVSPATRSLVLGDTVTLAAVARDAAGNVLAGRTFSWSSSDTAVARVSTQGRVTAAKVGSATVTATIEGKAGSASITVTSPLTAQFVLAFHACNSAAVDCGNPSNHVVQLAQGNDGASWTPVPGFTAYSGSVPDVIRKGNTLYVFTPGRVRRYRIDTGRWEDPVTVTIRNADGSSEFFVDPSPILDSTGNIVLFYLVGGAPGTGDPASCPAGQTSCTKLFRSATEVQGSDGTSFTVDSGNRAQLTIASNESASDPDIFPGPSGFVMYISRGPSVQATTASDLRGSYTNVSGLPNGLLVQGAGGIPAGYYDSATSRFWTYVHIRQGNIAVIRRALHTTLSSQLNESQFTTVVAGATYPGLGATWHVESPGITSNVP